MGGLLKIVEDIQNEFNEAPKTQFWRIKRNAKNPNLYVLLPDTLGFIAYLESLGVCFEATSKELVREEKGIVSKIEISDLKRIVQKDIQSLPEVNEEDITRDEILSMIMANEARLFKTKGLLEFLSLKEFDWIKSNESTGFFFYRNGVACVVADNIELKPYESIEGYVWESQIIDRDFELVEPGGSDWADFLYKAAGETEKLVANLNSSLGYILHTYKDSANAYLVLFGEAVADSNLGGGAGKGVTGAGIAKIVNTAFKDMRQYSASDAFKWSMVNQDTAVFILSDLKQNFDHQILYNLITEGFEVNKKNEPVAIYPFADSPKLLASTNYSLDSDSGHGGRRVRLVEFSQHWNQNNTPDKFYGKLFFDQWDENEWKKFDSYMLLCVAQYLKNGFPKIQESATSKKKRIMNKPGMYDLIEWVNNYTCPDFKSFANIYLDYSTSKHVTGKPIGKNVWLARLEEAVSILKDKHFEVAENGSVKSIKIW